MNKPKPKKTERQHSVAQFDSWEISGKSLDDLIKELTEIKTRREEEGYRNLWVIVSWFGDDGSADQFEVVGIRDETEKEKAAREKREVKTKEEARILKQKTEEMERKTLAALIKKYGVPDA